MPLDCLTLIHIEVALCGFIWVLFVIFFKLSNEIGKYSDIRQGRKWRNQNALHPCMKFSSYKSILEGYNWKNIMPGNYLLLLNKCHISSTLFCRSSLWQHILGRDHILAIRSYHTTEVYWVR